MVTKTTSENIVNISVILPWLAGFSFLCAVAAITYRFFRPRFPVRVNCWFCCKDTTVPYGNRNCWDCPSCDQYNGFTADNDYNKPIPSQYSESLNHPVPAANSSRTFIGGNNELCVRCNQNQLLKVKQLANFVACDETNFDTEVEAYRRHLDSVYQLCKACDFHVQQVLERQDRELWHKLQHVRGLDTTLSDQDSVCSSPVVETPKVPGHANILRMASFLCGIAVFLSDMHTLGRRNMISFTRLTLLPAGVTVSLRIVSQHACAGVVTGALLAAAAICVSGKHRLHISGAASLFSWLLLFLLHCGSVRQILSHPQGDLLLRCVTATLNVLFIACSLVFVRQDKVRRITLRKHIRRSQGEGNISVTETCDSSSSLTGAGDFESVSLQGQAQNRQMGMFAVPLSVSKSANVSPPSSLAESLRHRHRRPLISPARFKAPPVGAEWVTSTQNGGHAVSGHHAVHHAARLFGGSSTGVPLQRPPSVLSFLAPTPTSLLASGSTTVYSPSSVSGYAASDISSVFSDVRLADDPGSSCSDRSSVSSRCEVDTTTDCAPPAIHAPLRQQSTITTSLLGISVVVNLLLGLIFFFGLKWES